MPRQLTFDLPAVPALGREDFFVSPANTLAVTALDGWRDWPLGKMALTGPAGAGKTHLAHVFAASASASAGSETVATIVAARDLPDADIPTLATGAVVVEDVPAIAGDRKAETALFHLHNLVLETGGRLLVTGRAAPARWNIALPDLASRLAAASVATIDPPDDNLLAAVLAKLFADRQLAVDPDVIRYLTRRMTRDFAAAHDMVARLDALSLEHHRPITRPLAAQVLDITDDDAP